MASPTEMVADRTGLPLVDLLDAPPANIGWLSIDRPELGLLSNDDVFTCELCEQPEHAEPCCPDCRGHRVLHGYHQVGDTYVGLPAVLAVLPMDGPVAMWAVA